MKKVWTIIFSALVLCACNNASEEPDVPAPNPPSPEKPVVLSKPISEDFSGNMSSLVECKTLVVRDDFRYFPEFPSFMERNRPGAAPAFPPYERGREPGSTPCQV